MSAPLRRSLPFAWLAALVLCAPSRGAVAEDPPAPAPSPAPAPAPAPEPAPAPDAPSEEPDPSRGYLGFSTNLVQGTDAAALKPMGVVRAFGVYVTDVVAGGPAAKAGVKPGDVLVEYAGKPVPDGKDVNPKDEEAVKKFFEATWQPLAKAVKCGDTVTLIVDRGGTKTTLTAVAIDKATMDQVRETADEEARSVQVPAPKDDDPPVRGAWDFETTPDGEARPEGFLEVTGLWEVYGDETDAKNHVLKQYSRGQPWAVCLVTGAGRTLGDGTARVTFLPLEGEESVGGGIVVRARHRKEFYVARVDGVRQDLRWMVVKDGKATVLSRIEVKSPKMRTPHTLEVTCTGPNLRAVYDGTIILEAKDPTYAKGWWGLFTDLDAGTQFDAFEIVPAEAK